MTTQQKTPPLLFDIGANLTHDNFDTDRVEVIERAAHAGVQHIAVTGSSEESSRQALALAHQYPKQLVATAGIHPHSAKQWTDKTTKTLTELLSDPQVVAIGECGLDFYRDLSPRNQQQDVFSQQIELAIKLKKPLFLHERDAHEAFLEILKPQRKNIVDAVVHCFTGDERMLRAYLELDLYIGITGWVCDERRGQNLRRLLPLIPNERLLIETDAPYLIPRDLTSAQAHHSHRNEPVFLVHIAKTIAMERQQNIETLAEITTQNAKRFFRTN